MCAGYLWQSLAEVRSLSPLQACDLSGARGRNRTGTVFLPRDFKFSAEPSVYAGFSGAFLPKLLFSTRL